ncbi:MAG: hypothetical protein DRP85_04765 [Candidatus Makaraimicrobium thalassicum]|nr:MAG: hypothetical protein DRP85_04765 [Candidatus Omnitrophota bacterium]
MPGEMARKENAVKRIRTKISRSGIDALLVSDQYNIRYLTGFYSPGVMLLVTERDYPLFFVDSMNRTLAEKLLVGAKLHIIPAKGSIAEALAVSIGNKKIKKIGFNSENFSVSLYGRLSKFMPKVKFVPGIGPEIAKVPVSSILKKIRKIKTGEEARILREAAKETVRIWREVRKDIETGMSEKEIAVLVDICIRRRGHVNSFPTIAAIGENTAYPHAVPAARRLKRGEHVLVDFGIRFRGYCSDLTRTCDNGRIDRQIRDFRKIVREAQDFAIREIKPGVKIGSVVTQTEHILNSNIKGDFVLHGLGHGIGMDVHEEPFLHKRSHESLREGMVITVEPGLYKPGVGGVREEDMVLVTAEGCEVLTR